MVPVCAGHPDRPAVFHCEGCGRDLCLDCVEEGHRLYFCKFCRERALPLDAAAPTIPSERHRAERLARAYSLRDALGYVFRGRGAFTLPAYVLFLTFAGLLPGLLTLIPLLLVALLLPGFLFAIVRSTAEGDDELPDWPDYSEFGARLAEWLQTAGIAVAAFLPGLLLRRLAGCDVEDFLVPNRGLCGLAHAGGVALAFAIAMFGLGAVGTWESGWLSFRLDLHLEALLAGTQWDAPVVLLFVAGLLGISTLVAGALGGVPLLGLVVFHAATGYALFTTAHLAGVLFRRHEKRLEAIYLR
jgi:hypothetical protein